jgi:hypothetical protein
MSSSALAVPGLINYQGKLTDASGVSLDGFYNIRFSLYNVATGGTSMWEELQNDISVVDGILSVHLGSVTSFPSNIFDNDNLYLKIEIENPSSGLYETLSPRQQLTSTAYSMRAADSDTLNGMDSGEFASATHTHDSRYVNEGQSNSITSTMIVNSTITSADLCNNSVNSGKIADGSVTASDLQDGTALSEIIDDDGPGSGLNADFLDGLSESVFFRLNQNETVTGRPAFNGGTATIAPFSVDSSYLVSLLNADLLDGKHASAFASSTHNHSATQITSGIFSNSRFSAYSDLSSEGYLNNNSSTDLLTRSQADARFVNEAQANSITSTMILDSTITAADLASNSVGSSEIATSAVGASEIATNAVGSSEIAANAVGVSEISFPLIYTSTLTNGGLSTMINTSNGSSGNFPAGILGAANGDPGSYKIFGVMGLTPALGYTGSIAGMLPNDKIGVGGAADGGYGVAGVSNSHFHAAVYGENTEGTGVLGKHTSTGYVSPGVHGQNTGAGCGVLGDGGSGAGVIARSVSGNPLEAYDKDPYNRRFYVSNSGQVYADGSFNSGGADLAEMLPAVPGLEPGDVLVVDLEGKLIRSSEPSATNVVGVYSTSPGFIGGCNDDDDPTGKVPLAVLGIVPCKVSNENGPIKPGDLLVTSSIPGHAMKAPDDPKAGTVLGKALSSLESDTGLVRLYVTVN